MAHHNHNDNLFGDFGLAAESLLLSDGDEYVRCVKCGYGGCDVRVSGCGCTLHAVSGKIFLWIASLLVDGSGTWGVGVEWKDILFLATRL